MLFEVRNGQLLLQTLAKGITPEVLLMDVQMPATNLHKQLKEKTSNRVLLMDIGWDPDCDPDHVAKNHGLRYQTN